MTHGGKRIGAGRKPSGSPLINTSFRITPENWMYLQGFKGSRGKLINELIAEHRLKQEPPEPEVVPTPEIRWDGPVGAL